jgi:hypothetical protein
MLEYIHRGFSSQAWWPHRQQQSPKYGPAPRYSIVFDVRGMKTGCVFFWCTAAIRPTINIMPRNQVADMGKPQPYV